LEVGKTLRANGAHGPSYSETSSRPASYVPSTKDERSQPPFAAEETVTSASAPLDREHAILRAWIAADSATAQLIQEARSIARTSSAVLIRGENGAGKSLLAWILHALGPRANCPFISVDCASIPQDLLETELFGDELNAGTQSGRLKSAAGGTAVLDNVETLTIAAQAKLLRLMEDRRFDAGLNGRAVSPAPVDARIIALTSRNLDEAVARRTFREDLYYRLNVIPIMVPALRERPSDIRPLAGAFLRQLAATNRLPRLTLDPSALAALESYSFPGNVRELRHLLDRAARSASGADIQLKDLPPQLRESFSGAARSKISLEELERAYISEVLDHTRGKKTMAAKILGISRKTLLEKRKRYGLN